MGRSEAEPREADLGRVHEIDFHGQYAFEPTGGDLFDTVQVGSRMAFVLTDIAGRRPEIDPVLAETRKIFRASSAELLSAIDVNLMEVTEVLIHAINEALIETAKGVCFAPTMVGCYDHQLGVMAYINAGGQTALFHDSEGTRALPNASVPLGLFTHLPYDASIQAFEPGAMLLVVTKGVTESLGGMKPVASERPLTYFSVAKADPPARFAERCWRRRSDLRSVVGSGCRSGENWCERIGRHSLWHEPSRLELAARVQRMLDHLVSLPGPPAACRTSATEVLRRDLRAKQVQGDLEACSGEPEHLPAR